MIASVIRDNCMLFTPTAASIAFATFLANSQNNISVTSPFSDTASLLDVERSKKKRRIILSSTSIISDTRALTDHTTRLSTARIAMTAFLIHDERVGFYTSRGTDTRTLTDISISRPSTARIAMTASLLHDEIAGS